MSGRPPARSTNPFGKQRGRHHPKFPPPTRHLEPDRDGARRALALIDLPGRFSLCREVGLERSAGEARTRQGTPLSRICALKFLHPPVQFPDLVFQAVGHIVIPGDFRFQTIAIEIGDAALDFFNPVGPVGIWNGGRPVASIRPAYQRSGNRPCCSQIFIQSARIMAGRPQSIAGDLITSTMCARPTAAIIGEMAAPCSTVRDPACRVIYRCPFPLSRAYRLRLRRAPAARALVEVPPSVPVWPRSRQQHEGAPCFLRSLLAAGL